MTITPIPQSQKRFQESIGSLFAEDVSGEPFIFLKSSTDVGVIRNGGRNGARFAPKSFLSTFKKFSTTDALKKFAFKEIEVSVHEEEIKDFHEAQKLESLEIKKALVKNAWICHLGGGHDHVYPLLRAVSENAKKVVVVNIDAHADTRTDGNFHSGTPFRQFSEEFKGQFHLYQIGLNPFANSFSTLSPLKNGKMEILWKKDTSGFKNFFQKMSAEIDKDTLVIFSIDADALMASEVPGVSAINPTGLTGVELREIFEEYRSLIRHKPIIGIYELNPIYDSLGSLSMRTLGSFVFEVLSR